MLRRARGERAVPTDVLEKKETLKVNGRVDPRITAQGESTPDGLGEKKKCPIRRR